MFAKRFCGNSGNDAVWLNIFSYYRASAYKRTFTNFYKRQNSGISPNCSVIAYLDHTGDGSIPHDMHPIANHALVINCGIRIYKGMLANLGEFMDYRSRHDLTAIAHRGGRFNETPVMNKSYWKQPQFIQILCGFDSCIPVCPGDANNVMGDEREVCSEEINVIYKHCRRLKGWCIECIIENNNRLACPTFLKHFLHNTRFAFTPPQQDLWKSGIIFTQTLYHHYNPQTNLYSTSCRNMFTRLKLMRASNAFSFVQSKPESKDSNLFHFTRDPGHTINRTSDHHSQTS